MFIALGLLSAALLVTPNEGPYSGIPCFAGGSSSPLKGLAKVRVIVHSAAGTNANKTSGARVAKELVRRGLKLDPNASASFFCVYEELPETSENPVPPGFVNCMLVEDVALVRGGQQRAATWMYGRPLERLEGTNYEERRDTAVFLMETAAHNFAVGWAQVNAADKLKTKK